MRPVHANEAEKLALWRPMMVLDKTLYGPAYIESLIAQNPGLVTSKTHGRKTFPLEIWHMILDIITNDPGTHDFVLLRANYVEVGGKMGQMLACNKINLWTPLGQLQTDEQIEDATRYLARPDLARLDLPNPFHLDDLSQPWEIPTRVFSSKINSLHVEITVPEFIKHLEYGGCCCCVDKRIVRRETDREIGSQQLFQHVRAFRYMPVMCPVCVGREASQRCLEVLSRLGEAKYLAWLKEELRRRRREEEPFNRYLSENITTLNMFIP